MTWFKTLLAICLLRANPQDLPTSPVLTGVTLAMYYTVGVSAVLTLVSVERALLAAAVDAALLAAYTYTILSLREQAVRWYQTLAALTGCGALIGVIMAVVGNLLPDGVSSFYVSVPQLLWVLAVYGHILRHALSVSYPVGLIATVGYLLVSALLLRPLLPPIQIN